MHLQEIVFSTVNKQVTVDQSSYNTKRSQLAKNRLPFTIDVVKPDGVPVSITVSMTREGNLLTVHLLDEDAGGIVGMLYLAASPIFKAAYYVNSMMIIPAYQRLAIGLSLYKSLITQSGISFIGIDQSIGARKTWNRLSVIPGISLYAIKPTQAGNLFFNCVPAGEAGYAYFTADNVKKPVQDGSSFQVILTSSDGKMANFIDQHIELSRQKQQLISTSRTKASAPRMAA